MLYRAMRNKNITVAERLVARLCIELANELSWALLKSKQCFGLEETYRDGVHTTDELFAVGFGATVVVTRRALALALIAAAMLLDAAAEDSAIKACEKFAVP